MKKILCTLSTLLLFNMANLKATSEISLESTQNLHFAMMINYPDGYNQITEINTTHFTPNTLLRDVLNEWGRSRQMRMRYASKIRLYKVKRANGAFTEANVEDIVEVWSKIVEQDSTYACNDDFGVVPIRLAVFLGGASAALSYVDNLPRYILQAALEFQPPVLELFIPFTPSSTLISSTVKSYVRRSGAENKGSLYISEHTP